MTTCGASNRSPSHGWFLGWLITILVASTIAGSAVVTDFAHAYDLSTSAPVDVHPGALSDADQSSLSGVQGRYSPPSGEASGASTTHHRSVVATEAAGSSIDDLLQPGGSLIGKAGTDETIRELTGGLSGAQAMFEQLSQGGTVVEQTSAITRVELANNGGFVQLRTVMSRSPGTVATIDVNIPGLDITKLKFNP